MNMHTEQLLPKKIIASIKASLRVFKSSAYIGLAGACTILASAFVLWSFNLEFLWYILFSSPLTVSDKFIFFFDIFRSLFTTYSTIQSYGIVLFSVLFGINAALLLFVLKRRGFSYLPKKSSAGGFLFAIIGGGCIACGTSILAPLLASLGATAATPFLRDASTLLYFIGSALILYSIYKLGLVCAYMHATGTTKL